MTRQRIAVVGLGTVGAQTLWQLSKQDCDVTGFELFHPGHSRGAAGGESRLFRLVEMEDLAYQPLIFRSDQLWRELEAETGQTLRDLSGALTFGIPNEPEMEVGLQSAALIGDRAEVLTHEETTERFPMYKIKPNEIAIVDHGAGTIFPEKTIRTAVAAAREHGAIARTEARITGIEQHGDQVQITVNGETEVFDQVVVAVGAWTATLLPEMAPYLATRRLLSTWFLPRTGASLEGMKPYIRANPNYSYGLPTADGLAMKLGLGFPTHLPIESPDTARLSITEEDLEPVRSLVAEFLPHLEPYPMRMQAYYEAYTHNRHEYIAPHPTMDKVLVLAGFSGKGFKNSPVTGEIAARHIMRIPQSADAQFLLKCAHPTA
ncbi:FAD-dependent oxidoreductase [Galactobacter sp.]|uniref:FAD-dependent oxidoreductase n=1 Tax=Galactobacter sp. TaxID=2676125 RepID=UPI0025C19503|nr:FAD-dependent oxidoreductase [Galactobacter sp.]